MVTDTYSTFLSGEHGGLFDSVPVSGALVVETDYDTQMADERACEGTKRLQPLTIEQRFAAFSGDNPHIYELLVELALQNKRTGKHRTMKGLFEDLRSMDSVKTNGKPFKMDNDMTPYYARLIMAQEPELAGYFRLRHSRGDV